MAKQKKTHCLRGHPRTPDNVTSSWSCRICGLARSKEQRIANPDKAREASRRYLEANQEWERSRWLSRQGLDREVVYRYLLERGDVSVCDICQQECSSGRNLAIDHDHETGEIRGLLCGSCNIGLGKFKDSVKLMEIATEYLKNKGAK